MSLAHRLNRIERELDRHWPVDDEPDMSAEDVLIAQRIIERHYQQFGPPPAEEHESMVTWLARRSRVGSDKTMT